MANGGRRRFVRTDGDGQAPAAGQSASSPPRRRAPADRARGVYMISVAADLAGMHPQTLRIYESRGLITPKRSAKNTRLYSQEDVERLQRIQELTSELGMNLAGVERVFELEQELVRMRRRVERMERETEQMRRDLEREVERVRRSVGREIVRYQPQPRDIVPVSALGGVRVPVTRPGRQS